MYIFIIACLVSLITFSSCQQEVQKPNSVYVNFPQTVKLKARVISQDSVMFRYPFRIHIREDKAVVMDLHATEYFFHAFSYPDFHYLTSFGRRGDAPEEILSAENFRWNGRFLWTLDSNKSELTRFGFASSSDSLLSLEVVSLDEELLRALDFVQYDDSTFIIPDYSGDSRFCLVSRQGKLLRKVGNIPTTNEDALESARPALAQAWRSFIDYNPHNGILVAATQLGEVLEIYNLKDSTHIACIGPNGEPEFQISQGYGIPTGIMGFSDVQVTDTAIYVVFQGRAFKDIAQKARQGINLPDGGEYIYVFSLEAKPLRKYVLDYYVHGISVDEQKGVIITTDVNKDEPILEYSINCM